MEKTEMRVGCLLSADEDTKIVQFLGYGKFVGMEIPDENAAGLAELCRKLKQTNPKIVLDSGKVVWGCECWWKKESEIKKEMDVYDSHGFKIKIVDIDEVRKSQR
jgi:hypothetical protein